MPGLPTPVRVHRLKHYLSNYDTALRDSVVGGFTHGFRIPSTIQHPIAHTYSNHASAFDHSTFVTMKLSREINMGRVAGPFDVLTPADVILSPIGVVPKKKPGEFRLIHDLSFPKLDSVNSHTEKVYTEVTYEILDHCLSIIQSIGPVCLIAKADIKDAIRIIPIHPDDYRLLGFTWRDHFYYDRCLPMGCSTSCQTFELFATSLQWILTSVLGVQHMSHILDDFIFFGAPNSSCCSTGLQANSLNVPLRADKTVLPSTLVILHGIEVDTSKMRMRLPQDKLLDSRAKVDDMYRRKKVSLRQLQSLIGSLNFACKVVMPGRTFLRRLINITKGVYKPNHMLRLNAEARLDLSSWKLFLDNFNGTSLCLPTTWTSSNCIRLYSDASLQGFAAVYGKRWLQGRFPSSWATVNIAVKGLLPIVLAIRMWGPLLTNSRILFMCDNMSIVHVINVHTSKDVSIMRLLRPLVVATMSYNILFAAKHIPGKSNIVADALSRFQDAVTSRAAPWLNADADQVPREMLPW